MEGFKAWVTHPGGLQGVEGVASIGLRINDELPAQAPALKCMLSVAR